MIRFRPFFDLLHSQTLSAKLVRVSSSGSWTNQGKQVKHGHEGFLAQPGQSEAVEFESLD